MEKECCNIGPIIQTMSNVITVDKKETREIYAMLDALQDQIYVDICHNWNHFQELLSH